MRDLDPLELVSGLVVGVGAPTAVDAAAPSPLTALEQAILPALLAEPCFVSFSGGRDSSLVLAVATTLARRHGLPDPIPATNRFASAPAAEESDWQEQLVAGLGLQDWLRVEHDGELGAVGPVARRALLRHGLLWPFNTHFHLPLLEAASGGSLLTGVGGDELFAAAVRPGPRSRRRRALDVLPAPARASLLARRTPVDLPWLRPRAAAAVAAGWAGADAREPRSVRARVRYWSGLRSLRVGTMSLDALAWGAGTRIANPLADASVWGAIAAAAPPGGFADRTAAMRSCFDRQVPDGLAARRTKARFDEVFWTEDERRQAAAWDGREAPADLVDPERLRRHWTAPRPRAQSFLLLQAAWLAAWLAASGADQLAEPVDGRRQRFPTLGPAQLPLRQ